MDGSGREERHDPQREAHWRRSRPVSVGAARRFGPGGRRRRRRRRDGVAHGRRRRSRGGPGRADPIGGPGVRRHRPPSGRVGRCEVGGPRRRLRARRAELRPKHDGERRAGPRHRGRRVRQRSSGVRADRLGRWSRRARGSPGSRGVGGDDLDRGGVRAHHRGLGPGRHRHRLRRCRAGRPGDRVGAHRFR